MEVTVNQKNYVLTADCNVDEMLAIVLSTKSRSIAVAVNQQIVPRSQWPRRHLKAGDEIMLIKATQGG